MVEEMEPDPEVEKQFAALAREQGFNPVYLKEILRLRNQGHNNAEISRMTGISRTTVNNYLNRLETEENREAIGKLILLGLALWIGLEIAQELFSGD